MWSKYFELELDEALLQTVTSNGEEVRIIPHAVLESLLLNSEKAQTLHTTVHYSQINTNEPRHYAFLCSISDDAGRRVEAIGEALDATLDTEIAQNYPVLMAHKRSFDDAAIKYLGLEGKVYSDQQIAASLEDAADEPAPSQNEPTRSGTGRTFGTIVNGFPDDEDVDESFDTTENAPSPTTHRTGKTRGRPFTNTRGDKSSARRSNEEAHSPRMYRNDATTTNSVSFSAGFANEFDDETPEDGDEYDAVLTCSKLKEPLSIREAYLKYPDVVFWVANEMRPYSTDDKRNQHLCQKFLAQLEQED